jgi:hypothetical protein
VLLDSSSGERLSMTDRCVNIDRSHNFFAMSADKSDCFIVEKARIRYGL